MKKELIGKMLELVKDEMEGRKIVKTVPATKEEVEAFKELKNLRVQIQVLENKLELKKSLFWGKINDRLGAWNTDLHFDLDKKEIGYYADKE